MSFLNRFKKTPANHSEAVAAERPAISFDRIDELTPFLPAGSLKDLREIADVVRTDGETYTSEEIQKISAIKEAFLKKLAEAGEPATAEEIKGLFNYILGETEKATFDEEKFAKFKDLLGESYLEDISVIQNGIRIGGGGSRADHVKIEQMKRELQFQISDRKLPFTADEIDQFVDKLIVNG